MSTTILLIGAMLLACSPGSTSGAPAASSTRATLGDTIPAPGTVAGPEIRPIGANGVPAGYLLRPDGDSANWSTMKYLAAANGWDVTTGPAHILFSLTDRVSGDYTVSSTIQLLDLPAHREAFGIFFGGTTLMTPDARYTYFLVAHTGEYRVREKNAQGVRGLIAWEKSDLVPVGRGVYNLSVRVRGDSVKFFVNNNETAWLSKRDLSIQTDGLVGIRLNHNLHVKVSPVKITRP